MQDIREKYGALSEAVQKIRDLDHSADDSYETAKQIQTTMGTIISDCKSRLSAESYYTSSTGAYYLAGNGNITATTAYVVKRD